MKRILSALLLLISVSTSAQTPAVYRQRIALIQHNIAGKFYDPKARLYFETTDPVTNKGNHSFLWPLCGLVQAENEMEAASPAKSYIAPVMTAIRQYYSPRPPAPAYQAMVATEKTDSRYYDDNEWVAIALMDAWQRTHKKDYLDASLMIYRFLLTGHDQTSGGGFYWVEGSKKSKNTCSNGPAVLVALQLYLATHKTAYLDTAIVTYNWTRQHLLTQKGVYADAIRIPALTIDTAYYTYNTGTMLQSGVLLYKITRDKKYLADAESLARAGRKEFYRNNKLPGNYWFNAVMLRGYIELYHVDRNRKQLQFQIDDANRVWNTERDKNNLLGPKKVKSLIDQSAMLEIYCRLAALPAK